MSNTEKQSWWQKVRAFFSGEPKQKTETQKPQAKRQTSEMYVFVTRSGRRFHYDADCPSLQSAWSDNKVFKMDLSKAKKSGRTACNKCCRSYLHD